MGQSLNLVDIVDKQQATVWFFLPQFVGLCVFLLGGIAETSRPPFDLPEADTELVAGYHTEYSGMRWGLFQTAEYINMIVLSALAVTLFFDGWHFPWVHSLDTLGPIWFLAEARDPRHRLHLAARLAAAASLRPADALRLEGAAAGRDAERVRHGPPGGVGHDARSGSGHLQGLRRDAEAGVQEADHTAVPGVQAAGVPALPRPPPPPSRTRTASRSASAAHSAPQRARPTASASSRPRTPPTTASRPASATRASTRST